MKKFICSHLYKLNGKVYPSNSNVGYLTTHTVGRCLSHSSDVLGPVDSPTFKPQKAVILSRITRYEYEKLRFKGISEDHLKSKLERKRSDYQTLVDRHKTHYSCVEHMQKSLQKHDIETRVVNRPKFTNEILDWADVVFTAGGDGTFLDAASKILTTTKPVIGINTDPTRSEGRLCLESERYSATQFDDVLNRLLAGDFRWKWRQRIRITMSGHHANDQPIELSDQQLKYLEHRYTEHVAEHDMCLRPICRKGYGHTRILPVRALNEVFFGECLSSRVSYYELSVDGEPGDKQKSSGVTVCTGTGSTSWYFHINHIPAESVANILNIANKQGNRSYPANDNQFIKSVTDAFNDTLIFDPSDPYMGFTVRDPIINHVFQVPKPRGKVKKLQIASRMFDASLVLDGGCSFRFNDGAVATLEMFDEDALRTVDFD